MPETLPPPIEVTQAVCEEHIKGIANRLECQKSWIYRVCGSPEHDYLTRFLTFHDAVLAENPNGAKALIEYVNAWHLAKADKDLLQGADWDETLSDILKVFAEVVRTRKMQKEMIPEAARLITALQWLLRQQAADAT